MIYKLATLSTPSPSFSVLILTLSSLVAIISDPSTVATKIKSEVMNETSLKLNSKLEDRRMPGGSAKGARGIDCKTDLIIKDFFSFSF